MTVLAELFSVIISIWKKIDEIFVESIVDIEKCVRVWASHYLN